MMLLNKIAGGGAGSCRWEPRMWYVPAVPLVTTTADSP
jgi:hypothetical protein